jgi:hypothetical protein
MPLANEQAERLVVAGAQRRDQLAVALHAPTLKENARRSDNGGMGSVLNVLAGAGVAAAIVLAFWALLDFIDELQRTARR